MKLSPTAVACVLTITGLLTMRTPPTVMAQASPGQAVYQARCAQCHDRGEPAPSVGVLRQVTAAKIHETITTGAMRAMAAGLSDDDRWAVARYLAAPPSTAETSKPRACAKTSVTFDYRAQPASNGSGVTGVGNLRRAPDAIARLSRADASRLAPHWSTPLARPTFPLVAGGRLFTTTAAGEVLALAPDSGCVYWRLDIDGSIRSALVVDPWVGGQDRPAAQAPKLYFGDRKGEIYAVNAVTGQIVWRRPRVHESAFANLLAAPALHDGRLYVTFSSNEGDTGPNADPKVSCCTFRGMIAALDAKTGAVLWRHYTLPQPARPVRVNAQGVQQFGPSGGAVLATVTIDPARGLIYSVADNNYSDPRDDNSNAVYALDLKSGALVWHRKMSPGNPHNAACAVQGTNCPTVYDEANRSDWGFKAAPVLVPLPGGGDVLVAAQKSGQVWGLDPRTGAILWRTTTTSKKVNFGTMWGVAVSDHFVYATVGEFLRKAADGRFDGSEELGLYKIDVADGRIIWMAPVSADCPLPSCGGYHDAPLVTGGMVITLSYDQFLRVHDEASGAVLKRIDLDVDGGPRVKSSGGGPSIADGVIYAGTDRRLVAVSAR